MKLYYGGYGTHMYYTVAENEDKAIENIRNKDNLLNALPTRIFDVITNIDGFDIVPTKPIEKEEGDIVVERNDGQGEKSNTKRKR